MRLQRVSEANLRHHRDLALQRLPIPRLLGQPLGHSLERLRDSGRSAPSVKRSLPKASRKMRGPFWLNLRPLGLDRLFAFLVNRAPNPKLTMLPPSRVVPEPTVDYQKSQSVTVNI